MTFVSTYLTWGAIIVGLFWVLDCLVTIITDPSITGRLIALTAELNKFKDPAKKDWQKYLRDVLLFLVWPYTVVAMTYKSVTQKMTYIQNIEQEAIAKLKKLKSGGT